MPVEPREDLIADARTYIESSARRLGEEDEAELFAEGTRVRHRILGEGTVLSADADKKAYLIRFDAVETPRKIAFQAKLERINS